jgi:small-conductance mechanosensitive channel/CRP-like cAMP-binding protein
VIAIERFLAEVFSAFWSPEQPWLILGGFVGWLALRQLLPAGSQYVLKQTITFFILCLFGELGAAFMGAMGWERGALAFFELSRLGVGIALIRFGGLLLFRGVMPALRFEAPRILEDIAVTLAYCAWGLIRLRYAGLDLSQIVATSAVMTAIIAFAMQDTLGNVLGGLAIHLDHSVEIGDWVVADGLSGRVIDIRWRYTKIATRNGEKAVVPNSFLMKNRFSVVGIYGGKVDAWRRWIWFNVGFDHPPRRVVEAVTAAVVDANIANVARDPAPSVVLMDFGAGYARYALRYWLTDPLHDDPTDSEVRIHVFTALERAGIALALPEEVRHMVKENEAHEHALASKEMQRRVEALGKVELFRNLSQEELALLAPYMVHAPFARGDTVTRQGAIAHWLYILVTGEAEVWLEGAGDDRRLLTTLTAGSVFGEMGLMTGAPRTATVIAKTDIDAYRLGKEGLATLMGSRPAIAEDISFILATREAELAQARVEMDESARDREHARRRESILGRIHNFFKLPG